MFMSLDAHSTVNMDTSDEGQVQYTQLVTDAGLSSPFQRQISYPGKCFSDGRSRREYIILVDGSYLYCSIIGKLSF